MIQAFRSVNLLIVFLSELAMLGAFGYWAYHSVSHPVMKYIVALGLPLMVAAVWGLFIAPKAVVLMPDIFRMLAGLILFELAAWALNNAGQPGYAIIYGLIAGISQVLAYILR